MEAWVISPEEEAQLWNRAVSYLENGRPGDVEHTRSVVEYGKTLLAHEGGNPLVVIPALILHDVGWSRVDFSDFIKAPADAREGTESVRLHMSHGARIASDILKDVGFGPNLIRLICSIIAVHDVPEEIRVMDDLDATLVFEADWLDKYSPARRQRYLASIKNHEALIKLQDVLDEHKSQWFRTETAQKLLTKITSEP